MRWLYVDNSNLWIEGMRTSAVRKGLAEDISLATKHSIQDQEWRVDFYRLRYFCAGKAIQIARSVLYGSHAARETATWVEPAEKAGFEVVLLDRNSAGREKAVDTRLICDMLTDAGLLQPDHAEFVLVAGDADYVPLIAELVRRNFRAEVYFWRHAAQKLKEAASTFVCLDDHFDYLTNQKKGLILPSKAVLTRLGDIIGEDALHALGRLVA